MKTTYNLAVVYVHTVKPVLDQGGFALKQQLIRGPALRLTDGLHPAADVSMAIECQRDLLRISRLEKL